MRLADDRPIAASVSARRRASRALTRVTASFGLLAFAVADTHLHLLLATNRVPAGECARRVEISLQQQLVLGARFQAARVHPVKGPWHLQQSFLYVLRQLERHGIGIDPTHDGTSLPDLLGMRLLGRESARLASSLLPRLDVAGLSGLLAAPVDTECEGRVEVLPDAAAAAFALPRLTGRCPDVVRARRAAVRVARGAPAKQLSELLGMSVSSVRDARAEPIDAAAVRAVLLQWRLRTRLAERDALTGVGPEKVASFLANGSLPRE